MNHNAERAQACNTQRPKPKIERLKKSGHNIRSALLGLCQTAVLASWLLPFLMGMAVPQDPGFNIQCPGPAQKNTV